MRLIKIAILAVLMLGGAFGIFNHDVLAADNGVIITNFDISPKQVAVGATGNLLITFKLSISNPTQARQYCNDSSTFIWFVNVSTNTGNQSLRSGQLAWPTSSKDYNLDFTDPYTGRSDGVVNFAGVVGCGSVGGKEIVRSTSVPLTIGIGEPKYSCNSNNQCVSSTSGTYTNSYCDYKCTAATASQTYSFNITNPLNGGPNDLFDIINIVTNWIMYISVPLAVLWIMWAGFLMLTAGPKPENFKKGRDILKYALLGLAIIFIGKGFVSLIISVIQLGGTGTNTSPTTQSTTGVQYDCSVDATSCIALPSGTAGAYPDLTTCREKCMGILP